MIEDSYSVEDLERKLNHEGRHWAYYIAPIQAVYSLGLEKEYSRYVARQTVTLDNKYELKEARRVYAIELASVKHKRNAFWREMASLLNMTHTSEVEFFYNVWLAGMHKLEASKKKS